MYTPNYQEEKAIALLKNEITNWEQGEVPITDRKAILMTNVIKKARKNYFGIFDNEKDPVTGRKKEWVPLTEWIVEDIVKNIDIDTDQIKVKAKNYDSHGIAAIFRYVLKYFLDKISFGKLINNVIRLTAIDGTCYVKIWKEGKEIKARIIDSLNIIADPSANNLEETPVIERNFLSLPEIKLEGKAGKWTNLEYIKGSKLIDRAGFEDISISNNTSEIPMVDVYERYGWMEKCILTGKESDEGDYVYGLIIGTGMKDKQPVIHLVKEVKDHPYVIFKFKDIWNRLAGRGIGEILFSLQASVNETKNIRKNAARIGQTKLWKARGGVTPQQFKKLFTTQVIKLKSQRDDIEMIDTGTVDPSSYKDEEVAVNWGVRVTGSFDKNQVTASTPATNALIQERGSQSGFNLTQENIGFAIQEMIEKKMVPLINKIVRKGDILRITGAPKDLEIMEEKYIKERVYSDMKRMMEEGQVFLPGQAEAEVERLKEEFKSMGTDRYLTVDQPFNMDCDIEVTVDNEELNSGIIAQSITQALSVAAQYPNTRIDVDETIKELFDTLGLDGNRLIQAKEELGEAQARAEMVPQLGVNEATLNPTPNSRPV